MVCLRQVMLYAAICVAATSLLAAEAEAEAGRVRNAFFGGPSCNVSCRSTRLGAGAGLGVGLSEFWELELRGSYFHPVIGRRQGDAYQLLTGISGRLDFLRWVPYAGVLGGVVGGSSTFSPVVSLDLGADYLLDRHWSCGARYSTRIGLANPYATPWRGGVVQFNYAWGL